MTTQIPSALFVSAALLPTACLLAAAVFGGLWPLVAVLSMTGVVLFGDVSAVEARASDSMAHWLPGLLCVAHFATLSAVIWAVGQPDHLSLGQKAALAVGMGLFAGQMSNALAHELIHRSTRRARGIGTAIYCSLLNGQHVSAHLLLHHPFAGTKKDPCSAPLGRSYYRFALQASRAELLDGWRAETQRRSAQPHGWHPYAVYCAGSGLALLAAWALGGAAGLVALILIAAHAQSQLLLSDYVQHYGLRRGILATGKPEPMGPQHSWNAPHTVSGALMLNAPRHSDHHMRPARGFPHLTLDDTKMPMLPYPLPVMGALALCPPLWRRIMDPKVSVWMPATAEGAQPPAPRYQTTPIV